MQAIEHCHGYTRKAYLAARMALGLSTRPDAKAMETLGERWRPYRAVAARLLWAYYGAVRLRLRTVSARAVALQRTVDERTTELRAREQELSAQNEQLGLQAELINIGFEPYDRQDVDDLFFLLIR